MLGVATPTSRGPARSLTIAQILGHTSTSPTGIFTGPGVLRAGLGRGAGSRVLGPSSNRPLNITRACPRS